MNNITYYFKDALDVAEAKAYLNMVTFYDKKLNAPVLPIACYYCDNFQEGSGGTGA
jgi:hypothetical protein